MLLSRRSMLTNTENILYIPMHPQVFTRCEVDWVRGMSIQDAFPMLDADQREFVKTGVTAREWDDVFGPDESEESDTL